MNNAIKYADGIKIEVFALLQLGLDEKREEVVADKLKECCEWLEAYYDGVVALRKSQVVR